MVEDNLKRMYICNKFNMGTFVYDSSETGALHRHGCISMLLLYDVPKAAHVESSKKIAQTGSNIVFVHTVINMHLLLKWIPS